MRVARYSRRGLVDGVGRSMQSPLQATCHARLLRFPHAPGQIMDPKQPPGRAFGWPLGASRLGRGKSPQGARCWRSVGPVALRGTVEGWPEPDVAEDRGVEPILLEGHRVVEALDELTGWSHLQDLAGHRVHDARVAVRQSLRGAEVHALRAERILPRLVGGPGILV